MRLAGLLPVALGLGLFVGCGDDDGAGAQDPPPSAAPADGGGGGQAAPRPSQGGAGEPVNTAQPPLAPDAGDTPSADGSTADRVDAGPRLLRLPPGNAAFDYQLGGPYAPPAGVQIVSRDRTEEPARGLYNICYVNGFQIQQDEASFWLDDHPELVLRDGQGDPVIDPDWDEMLIDVSTASKRAAVAAIVGGWVKGCADAGFDAVEIDNLDTFSRSTGLIDEADAVATMALFAQAAHAAGLAIAQKNSAELVGRRGELGTDFAVAEECNRYDECDRYVAGYDDLVFVIEYGEADFDAGCGAFPNLSIVLRDLPLTTPGDSGYVYDGC